MYSQSKGRQFGPGEQSGLVEYLVQTCLLDPNQVTEQDRKLNLILSKDQQHPSSLRQPRKIHEEKFWSKSNSRNCIKNPNSWSCINTILDIHNTCKHSRFSQKKFNWSRVKTVKIEKQPHSKEDSCYTPCTVQDGAATNSVWR